MNIENIIEGWYNTINSQSLSEEKKAIAQHRGLLCSTCTEKKTLIGWSYCNQCGCKLPQKTYSFKETNKCPLGKWKL